MDVLATTINRWEMKWDSDRITRDWATVSGDSNMAFIFNTYSHMTILLLLNRKHRWQRALGYINRSIFAVFFSLSFFLGSVMNILTALHSSDEMCLHLYCLFVSTLLIPCPYFAMMAELHQEAHHWSPFSKNFLLSCGRCGCFMSR